MNIDLATLGSIGGAVAAAFVAMWKLLNARIIKGDAQQQAIIDSQQTEINECKQDRDSLRKALSKLEETVRRFLLCPENRCPVRRDMGGWGGPGSRPPLRHPDNGSTNNNQ